MKSPAILIVLSFLGGEILAQSDLKSQWFESQNEVANELGLTEMDSTIHEVIYRIWYDDFQVVEVIENKDDIIEGHLINYVTRLDSRRENFASQTLQIPDYSVANILMGLKVNGAETLPDSYEIEGYVHGYDGTTISFVTFSPKNWNYASYWEPRSDNYQDKTKEEVIKVRNILQVVDNEINRKVLFDQFVATLGYGKYKYGMIKLIKN